MSPVSRSADDEGRRKKGPLQDTTALAVWGEQASARSPDHSLTAAAILSAPLLQCFLIPAEHSKRQGEHQSNAVQTEVSDCSLMTNLWLLGSMNSSPSRRKGRGVTVTTREKSRRRREKTRPWRRAEVTGSSLTKVHWRPPPFCCWYCMVGPGVR